MFVGMGLRIGLLGSAAAASFTPAALFAASEPGFWYDPSDLTTLFQDNAGTTPVTAVGQPVGLLLDKSKGLVLGSELVTNGSFSTDTNWTKSSGVTISGGVAVFSSVSDGAGIYQTVPFTAGKFYRVTYTLTISTGSVASWVGAYGVSRTSSGVYSETIIAGSTNSWIGVFSRTAGTSATIDNISVKELAGNHATQATAASRSLYQVDANGKAYLSFDGVDDFLVTPTITPGVDKAQVFAGVRKLSDSPQGHIAGGNGNNPGQFELLSGGWTASANRYGAGFYTNILSQIDSPANFAPPRTDVLSWLFDTSGATGPDKAKLNVNAAPQVLSIAGVPSAANFGAFVHYIGRRGGTTLPFNGRIYSLITRFGANLTAQQITDTETWVNGKTGAY